MNVTETVHSGISENSLGSISYLTLIPAVVFLAIPPYNRSTYVRFHAWQSVIVAAIAFLANFAITSLQQLTSLFSPGIFLSLVAIIGVAYTLTMIWCAVCALNGKLFQLPVVGSWAERQASR